MAFAFVGLVGNEAAEDDSVFFADLVFFELDFDFFDDFAESLCGPLGIMILRDDIFLIEGSELGADFL